MNGRGAVKVVAVMRSPEGRDQLVQALDGFDAARVETRVGELKTLGIGAIHAEAADILVLEVDPEDGEDMAVLNLVKLDSAVTNTPIIATAADLTPAAVRRFLREGIDDFVPQPLQQADLIDAIEGGIRKMRERRLAAGVAGSVLTFVKAAGGMGATTLAVNTACSLVDQRGKDKAEVCLLDLDLQFGSAGLYLDLETTPGLINIVRAPERLDGQLLRGSTVQHKGGLNVLTAPNPMMPLDALKPELMAQILDLARQEFDYVVVDLPQVLTAWSETVLTQSDFVFLVSQLQVPALRQAKKFLSVLQDEGLYTLPLRLILNRHQSALGWNSRVSLGQAEKALGRKFDYFIPNDYGTVLAALNQGVPVAAVKRRSKFCRKVQAMAESVRREIEAARRAPAAAAAA